MTETTLKVQLSELHTVRILCRRNACAGVVELPISRLGMLQGTRCPVCHNPFSSEETHPGIFVDLGNILDRLSRQGFALEFPVRLDDAPAGPKK